MQQGDSHSGLNRRHDLVHGVGAERQPFGGGFKARAAASPGFARLHPHARLVQPLDRENRRFWPLQDQPGGMQPAQALPDGSLMI